jgi:hypothetical protein
MKLSRNYSLLFVSVFFLCVATLTWALSVAGPASASARPFAERSTTALAVGTPVCGPSFSLVASPNITGGDHALNGVAVVSATDIWAAGFYTNTDGVAQTLIERWDGTQWSIVPSPNAGSVGNYLQSIAASSSSNVWAVGFYRLGTALMTLTIHWNGTQWDVVSSPSPSTTENYLYGVTVISDQEAWAVGYYNNGTFYRTLTMRYNTTWQVVSSPNPTLSLGAGLRAVSGLTGTDIWAVGAYVNLSTILQTYILHWTGSSWSTVSSPNPGSGNNALVGVSASAPNNAWAVGLSNNGTRYVSLALRWNGSTWSSVTTPAAGTGDNGLSGVLTFSQNDAYAVGAYDDGGIFRTLALRWDGTAWTQANSDNPGSSANGLFDVDGTAGNIWAVGAYSDGGPGQTLVERYTNVPCATGTPTDTPQAGTPTLTPTGTPSPTGSTTSTPPASATPTSPASATLTGTATPEVTQTPGGTSTPSASPTTCPMTFTDVQPSDYFYVPVRYLYCAGVISGYADNTFRPFNNTTRGQLTKIVVLAEGWVLDCTSQHFTDVPPSDPFYCYVETAVSHGVISGYSDGTFKPGNNVTRGQLSKIVVLAEGWADDCTTQHFSDVPPSHTFYCYIETAFTHGIISGYADGTFRPGNNATRGQISKIVYQAITGP